MSKSVNATKSKIHVANDSSSVISDDDSLNGNAQKLPLDSEEEISRLKKLVADKSRQISDLHILMESTEMLPGVNLEKYKGLIGTTAMTEVEEEMKEAKIVALSKKIRQQIIQINKLNSLREADIIEKKLLNEKYEKLQQSFTKLQFENRSEVEKKLEKDLALTQRSIDDFKRKNDQLKDEVKNLQRILHQELGDVSLDKASDPEGGWKGRAQQIKILKSKLMKYESASSDSVYDGASTVMGGSPGSVMPLGTTRTKTIQPYQASVAPSVRNLEAKVINDIAGLSIERKNATENIIQERDTLQEQYTLLDSRVKGYKARITTLENEVNQFKQQMQVLINKSNTDDQFIDALKEEMYRLKSVVNSNNLRLNNNNNTHAIESGGNDAQELIRLKRLCKQQSEQLNTQDDLIHELRNNANRK